MLGLRLAFGMHTYQTLGDLELIFDEAAGRAATEYRRELDLDTAVARVSYKIGDATFTREVFSSPVDQAIVVRLSCDRPGRLSFDAGMSRPGAVVETPEPGVLTMHGIATGRRQAGWRGVKYEARMRVEADNGRVSEIEKGIRVENADAVTLRLVAATSYRGKDPRVVCERQLAEVGRKGYAELRRAHIAEHQRLFRRVELDLGQMEAARLPTDRRLEAFRKGVDDPGLIALFFQFGRYLLISSSRPGSMAINLWGKWIKSLDPDYNGDYHININIQMNYWPAEVSNLAECHEPFFDLLDDLRPRGRITARETYGARGFTAHHATDAWLYTAAIGNPPYGMWPFAPAWSAQHLWEHYLFGGDREYLARRSYPIMKEAAEFSLDYLVEDPRTGYMVSGPSTSPENRFLTPDGEVVSLSLAPTMDIQLLQDLFGNCIEASKLLDVDEPFRERLEALRSRLTPMKVGDDGRLLEWAEPFREQNPGHRHISHLWGLAPGNQITEDGTPELFEAARKSLDHRVANGAAASPEYRGITAWVTNAYVRLRDGEKAYGLLKDMLTESS
jgi:alpha-L-fucosidase 2